MITIQVSETLPAERRPPLPDLSEIEHAAQAVLDEMGAPANTFLTVVLSDDDQLHALNRQFLEIDAPTDVLSFPAGQEQPDPDTGELYLGDVLISYPRAEAQAGVGGHPVLDELRLLVVHGVLHLLGYDHAEPHEKDAMWAAQARILQWLGSTIQPPE